LHTVYLSLGSNLGDRREKLRQALAAMQAAGVAIQRVSAVYETEPVGLRSQPLFLNVVVEAQTEMFPVQLLDRLQSIEIRLGRRRLREQGPRTIDIDILFYGAFRVRTERLSVPHPRLERRRFVLEPMAELAPQFRHPANHLTMLELLAATPDHSAVRRLTDPLPIQENP
jgi:2-amino-4-hydroxy-6-hydroxymethyldihydropteridine diphosphokinase